MKNNKIVIIIDPRCNHVYASYYIKGLYDIFGYSQVKYSLKYFKEVNLKELIKDNNDPMGGDDPRLMLFVVKTHDKISRIAIDYRDKKNIFDQAYKWCNKYAKVNYDRENTSKGEYSGKAFSIPPSFAIPYSNLFKTIFTALHNTWLCYFPKKTLNISMMIYFLENISTYFKRQNISKYKQAKSKTNYVFFISSLWQYRNSEEYDKYINTVNNNRVNYIKSCKQNDNIEFEGGLYVYNNDIPDYLYIDKDLLFNTRISHKEYIQKTMLSFFVFNTPSVWGCHGWKLGEFLAMGKAIISTNLYRDLPESLTHGENIHYVNDKSEIENAIEILSKDNEYRHRLERGAKQYYEKYCSPQAVVSYIIKQMIKS